MTVQFRGMTVWRGADVSGYDPNINWAAYNWDFVFIKSTENTSFVSQAWRSWNYPGKARARGIHVGAYHFAHPGNPAAQVRFMRSVVGPLQTGDLRPVLDIEGSGWNSSNAPAFAAAFIAECRRQFGCAPTVYCSASFFKSELRSGAGWKSADVPLWVAHYTSANRPSVGGWAAWQYTSTGSIPGSSRPGDCNVAVDLNALLASGGSGGGGTGSGWIPLTAQQIEAHGGYKPGDAPVYGMLEPVTIRSVDSKGVVHHSTWDARCVPADRCPKMWNGSGTLPNRQDYLAGLWVDFLRDLFLVLPWVRPSGDGQTYSWAHHYGLQKGGANETNGYFSTPMVACVMEWSRLHGIPATDDSTKRGITTPLFWAKMLDQKPA